MLRVEGVSRATCGMLAALTLLGAALRLYGLDTQSLWNDELATYIAGQRSAVDILTYGVARDHLPAYFLFMRVWILTLGDSETLLRLPSALCGIATIPAMFALGRRWFGPLEGLIAAAMTAVAWAPVFYSQEARPYAMLLLAITLSTAWITDVVRALRAGATVPRGTLIGAGVAAAEASQLHFFGTMFVALQAAAAGLATWRAGGARTIAAFDGIVALAFLPAAYRFLQVPPEAPSWLPAPTAAAPWTLLLFLFNGLVPLALAVCALWASLLVRAARAPAGATTTWLAFGWVCTPTAIALAYSYCWRPTFMTRALLIILPAAYLLVARSLTQLPVPRRLAATLAAALCAVLLVDLIGVRAYHSRPTKTQFREAAAFLAAHDAPATPALLLACAGHRGYFDYYLRRLGSPRRVDAIARDAAEADEQVRRVAAEQPALLWVLAGHRECSPTFIAALGAEMTLVDERRFGNAAVWQFHRRDG